MNKYLHLQYIETKSKFDKFSNRLQRSQERGEFQKLSSRKQHFLVSRVKKLWEKLRILEVQLKICTTGVSLALLLMVSNAGAQEQFVVAPEKNPLPPPTIFGWDPILADLDSDGDLDLFLTSINYYADPRIIYYRNNGTAISPVFQEVQRNQNPFRDLTEMYFKTRNIEGMGDVDGDGDLDILSDEGFLLRNTGGNESPLFTAEQVAFPIDSGDLGDIDGDGDLDLLQVTTDSTLSVLPNTGDAINFNIDEHSPLSIAIGNWNNIIDWIKFTRAVDLDDDGDLDLLFGGVIYDYDNDIFWEDNIFIAENTGTLTDPVFSLVDQANNPYSDFGNTNVQFGDLDGDGDFDLLVVDYSSGFRYFELDNGVTGENKELIPEIYDGIILPVNYVLVPQFADIDGDGDPDILVLDYYDDWNMVYFEFQETGEQLKYVRNDQKEFPFLTGEEFIEIPYFVDMDVDGDLDVMVLSYDYNTEFLYYFYYENTGTAQSPVYEAALNNPVLAREYVGLPSFADIDGDGDTDMFLSFEKYDNVAETWVGVNSFYENRGADELDFSEKSGSENPLDMVKETNYEGINYVQFQFGDIDEDGDLDAAFTDYYGAIYYLENTGSKTEPSFVDKSGESPFSQIGAGYYGKINFVDMDGDGDLDLVTHGYYEIVATYYENLGGEGGTGIFSHLLPDQLDLFPNPAVGELTIRMQNDVMGEMTYEIHRVDGKQVTNGTFEKREKLLEFRLPVEELESGFYMVRIWSGEQVYLSKFVKH